jgi:hypothetical protein
LATLNFGQRCANHVLGQARALATLAGDAKGCTDITVAAAALVDGFANLTVSNTFTETNVHGAGTWLGSGMYGK